MSARCAPPQPHGCTPLKRFQVRFKLDDPDMELVVASIADRFPLATLIELEHHAAEKAAHGTTEQLASIAVTHESFSACLAALPDGCCWPAVERLRLTNGRHLPAPAVVHIPRLCPRLHSTSLQCHTLENGGAEVAAACEALAAVARTLEVLDLALLPGESCEPADAQRIGAAIARLRRLLNLKLNWDVSGPCGSAGVLATALPHLTRLTKLDVKSGRHTGGDPLPQPAMWPSSLRELVLRVSKGGSWAVGMLDEAPQLCGVTKLKLVG